MLKSVFSGPPAPARRSQLDLGLLLTIAGIALYALLFGWAILSGLIAPERAYLLIAVPCLVPALWYLYGFFRSENRDSLLPDTGLLFSAAGWFLLSLTFVVKHLSSVAAVSQGFLPEGGSNSPLSWFLAFLSVGFLIYGAIVSGKNWTDRNG